MRLSAARSVKTLTSSPACPQRAIESPARSGRQRRRDRGGGAAAASRYRGPRGPLRPRFHIGPSKELPGSERRRGHLDTEDQPGGVGGAEARLCRGIVSGDRDGSAWRNGYNIGDSIYGNDGGQSPVRDGSEGKRGRP